jgi:MoaA/NifB/PqqE/SkfB family radical SAM enzyme
MDTIDHGIQNAEVPANFYKNNVCMIGYSYVRYLIDGSIRPCCIYEKSMGNTNHQSWEDIWHSDEYENFRHKMLTIHRDHFHLFDPQWTFCQQCSHMALNEKSNALLSIPNGRRQD